MMPKSELYPTNTLPTVIAVNFLFCSIYTTRKTTATLQFNEIHLSRSLCVQAAKILANVIVLGSAVLGRAFVQAYRQALSSMVSCHPKFRAR